MSNYKVTYTLIAETNELIPVEELITAESPGSAFNASNPILKDYPDARVKHLRITNTDTGEGWSLIDNKLISDEDAAYEQSQTADFKTERDVYTDILLEADLKTLKEFEPQTRAELEALEYAEFHRDDDLILDSLQDLCSKDA